MLTDEGITIYSDLKKVLPNVLIRTPTIILLAFFVINCERNIHNKLVSDVEIPRIIP